jgi:hypothetical protein
MQAIYAADARHMVMNERRQLQMMLAKMAVMAAAPPCPHVLHNHTSVLGICA